MLRKNDGSTVLVPIKRLSTESRALAKRLYERQRTQEQAAPEAKSPPPAEASPDASGDRLAIAASEPPESLDFVPPAPRPIPPRAPFPENASLQETVDFYRSQVLAGHPEVFWYGLPSEMRQVFNDPELRRQWERTMADQVDLYQPLKSTMLGAVEVLVNKKKFILNSSLMEDVPPPLLATIREGYDPAIGLLYETLMLPSPSGEMAGQSVTEVIDVHGPRVGSHLRELLRIVPSEMIDPMLVVDVEQTSESTGTITFPHHENSEPVEVVRYQGRWVPEHMVERWNKIKDNLTPEYVAAQNEPSSLTPKEREQVQMGLGVMTGMADSALERLRAADSQEEFDQALMEVSLTLGVFMNQMDAGAQSNPVAPPDGIGLEPSSSK